MSINASSHPRAIRFHRVFRIGLMIIMGIAVTSGFVWMQTDHFIAPLRLIEGLWRLFICRCPLFPDLFRV